MQVAVKMWTILNVNRLPEQCLKQLHYSYFEGNNPINHIPKLVLNIYMHLHASTCSPSQYEATSG